MATSTGGLKFRAAAAASNNIAVIGWNGFEPGWLGYAVSRENKADGTLEELPQWLRFTGESNKEWKPAPTSQYPWQALRMRDLTAKRGGTYRYHVTPVTGKPGLLTLLKERTAVTQWVSLTTDCGPHVNCCFNNGFLSTQFLSHLLPVDAEGKPDQKEFLRRIADPTDPLFSMLSAGLDEFVLGWLKRAHDIGGSAWAMLYELTAPRAISLMKQYASLLTLLLGNTGKDDEENAPFRKELKDAGVKVHDIMVAEGHIFHMKVFILLNKLTKAIGVSTGSTNITNNGFVTQANNAIQIMSEAVAGYFLEFAQELIKDNGKLGEELRKWCMTPRDPFTLPDGTVIEVFFAPCTEKAQKPPKGTWSPGLQRLWNLFVNAKRSIHFNAFMPGTPSLIDMIVELRKERPDLLIEGTVNSKDSLGHNLSLIYHHADSDPIVVPASSFSSGKGDWLPEIFLLQDAHAAVHSKCGVVDVGLEEETTFTGSHNLGEKAEAFNVENLLFIRRNPLVAQRYFCHCTDVREHYLSRFLLQDKYGRTDGQPNTDFRNELTADDSWQKRYAPGGQRAKKAIWLVDALAAGEPEATAEAEAAVEPVAAAPKCKAPNPRFAGQG